MSTLPPASGLGRHHSYTPEGIPAASQIAPGPSPSTPSPLLRFRTLLSHLRSELHLSPPPHADALAPSMTSVFPRFSYVDINLWIWVFGWRYRAIIRGWEQALASGGRGERERNWSGLALGAF